MNNEPLYARDNKYINIRYLFYIVYDILARYLEQAFEINF